VDDPEAALYRPRTFAYSKTYTVTANEDLALQYNAAPPVVVWLGKEGAKYLSWVTVDLSSLLAGDTVVGPLEGALADGVEHFSATLSTADVPFLTPGLAKVVNPLSVRIVDARGLPGMGGQTGHPSATAYDLQREHCLAPYAVLRTPTPGLLRGAAAVATNGAPGGARRAKPARAGWNHATTFLVGHLDKPAVEECLSVVPVVVEVHDRHPVDLVDAQRAQWQARVAAAPDGASPGASPAESSAATPEPDASPPSATYPLAEADAMACEELTSGSATAGDGLSHGLATFRIDGLLDTASQRVSELAKRLGNAATRADGPIRLKLRAEIVPAKRRVIPKGGVDDWNLTREQCAVRRPGAYCSFETPEATVRIDVQLARPLLTLAEKAAPELNPFTRAVVVFEYGASEVLRAVVAAMDAVNAAHLSDITGSLRSYELSEAEQAAAEAGALDIISGVQVVDEECRMIIVEGLPSGVADLLAKIPRARANDGAVRVLSNADVRFKKRLWLPFNVSLKQIRLREPLPVIVETPDIYNRIKVSGECFEALNRLLTLRHANRLAELQLQDMFPTLTMLVQIESKYGESISKEDIVGGPTADELAAAYAAAQAKAAAELGPGVTMDDFGVSRAKAAPRKAATDSNNAAFEESLLAYRPPDYLTEQQGLLEVAAEQWQTMKAEAAEARADDKVLSQFVYSGQKLQYTELKKAEMRKRLSAEKDGVFTYSLDFQSAAVSLVDETRLAQDAKEANQAAWMTKRGWVYPAPKKPSEYNVHPHKPSESRVDILKEQWIENELHPTDVARDAELPDGQSDFDCIPSNGKQIFGGQHLPVFEREYDSACVGHYAKLPRGRKMEEKNPDFFKSVHLTGAGLAQERAATKKREAELWQAKVVVDDLDFKVGGFVQRDKVLQINKTADILKGAVQSKALRLVRNATLPSGKKIVWETAPFSAFSGELYEDPKDFTADLRASKPETFVATDANTGEPVDFMTHIHRDILKPKSHTVRSRYPIDGKAFLPLVSKERVGERWARPAEGGGDRRSQSAQLPGV